MKNKNISGAEAVVHSLLNEGVDLVWGYPGGAIMPVYDEFYKFQDMNKEQFMQLRDMQDLQEKLV